MIERVLHMLVTDSLQNYNAGAFATATCVEHMATHARHGFVGSD